MSTPPSQPSRPGRFDPAVLRELAAGYGIQIVSMVLLTMQNLLLPILLGTEEFGRLAFVLASSALLYSFYDNGYNLLVMRKKELHSRFMRCKTELFALAALGYVVLWAVTGGQAMLSPLLVLPHAFMMTWFSYIVHVLLAARRMRHAALFSVTFVALGFALPLVLVWLGLPVIYAPLGAVLGVLAIAQLVFPDLPILGYLRRSLAPMPRGLRYRWGLFLKQAQISAGTIVDSLIVWGGVYAITQLQGFHEAAVFRVAMSILALMTQTIPVFKPTFLRLSRRTEGFGRLIVVTSAGVLLVGVLQWAFVWWAGAWILDRLFPEFSTDLYAVLIVLALVAALKVILELQTVLLDTYNALAALLATIATAAAVSACVALALAPGFELVLVFYALLCLFNLGALMRARARRDARLSAAPTKDHALNQNPNQNRAAHPQEAPHG